MGEHCPAMGAQPPKSRRLSSFVQKSSLGAIGPGHDEPLGTVNKHDEEAQTDV